MTNEIDTTIQFLMDTLKADSELKLITDNKIGTEFIRNPVQLNGTYKTVVGLSILSSTQQSYFLSQIRGYIESEIIVQISVLSAYKSNDQHCRRVVDQIESLLQDLQYIGSYRIFINSIKSEVSPDVSEGKWSGKLTVGITRFDPE